LLEQKEDLRSRSLKYNSPQHYSIRPGDSREGFPVRQFFVPAGSVVLGDYRTLHRGIENSSLEPRPVAMLIYGRDWWADAVNYKLNDIDDLPQPGNPAAVSTSDSPDNKAPAPGSLFSSLSVQEQATLRPAVARRKRLDALYRLYQQQSQAKGLQTTEQTKEQPAAAASGSGLSEREAMFWDIIDKWQDNMYDEVREALAWEQQQRKHTGL